MRKGRSPDSQCKTCVGEYQRQYAKANPEKKNAQARKWQKANPAKTKAQQTSTGSRFARLKDRARASGVPCTLTREEYEVLLLLPCARCGAELTSRGFGITRLYAPTGYTAENVVSCCPTCVRRALGRQNLNGGS